MMKIASDNKTPYKKLDECHYCGEEIKTKEESIELKVFNDPWGTEPLIVSVHAGNGDGRGDCLDNLTDSSCTDFGYQLCPICERLIIVRCPKNGWREYFKLHGDDDICVACYQDLRLREGEDIETFQDGQIPGDFYNPENIFSHDWSVVPESQGTFINGGQRAKEFCKKALDLMKAGHKVLVDWESMAIGGGEGYCTLYTKEAAHA